MGIPKKWPKAMNPLMVTSHVATLVVSNTAQTSPNLEPQMLRLSFIALLSIVPKITVQFFLRMITTERDGYDGHATVISRTMLNACSSWILITLLPLASATAQTESVYDDARQQLEKRKQIELERIGNDPKQQARIEAIFAESLNQLDELERSKPGTGVGFNLESLPRIHRLGTRQEFDLLWNRFVAECRRVDYLSGRILFRQYHIADWEGLSMASEPPIDSNPRSAWVCDFVSDFVDLRTRQDWIRLAAPERPVDLVNHFSLDEFPLFHAADSELRTARERFVRTLDRKLHRLGDGLGSISLPQEQSRKWPNALDFRVIGWFGHSQWIVPTTQEGWMNVFNYCRPYAIERLEDASARLTFYWPTPVRTQVIQVDLTVGEHPKAQRFAISKVLAEREDELRTRRNPEFESRLFYRDGVLETVAAYEIQNSSAWRMDLFHESIDVLDEELFTTRDFVDVEGKIHISAELKAVLEEELSQLTEAK